MHGHSSPLLASAGLVLGLAAPLLAAAPARADILTVDGSNRTELLDCNGNDVLINGSANRLVLHGECRSLHVEGSGNDVQVDLVPGGGLAISGTNNHVTYTPIVPGPQLSAEGVNNVVGPGTESTATTAIAPAVPAAPPPAVVLAPAAPDLGTLVLTGDGQDRAMDCAGRNVLIEGNDGSFVLSGGCRGVTVQGHDDKVAAELVPGAHVAIGGDGVTLHYTLTENGPPPVVTVAGADSRAVIGTTP